MRQQASRFKRMCVFCGSSQGNKTSYHDAAIDLAKELVAGGIDLVYGGGSIGLMGLVSQAVYHGGRHVIGVIPKTLMTPEVCSTPCLLRLLLTVYFILNRNMACMVSSSFDHDRRHSKFWNLQVAVRTNN
ncbi:hypothetical protein ACQ4PT_027829 [Festuca glaucescens]